MVSCIALGNTRRYQVQRVGQLQRGEKSTSLEDYSYCNTNHDILANVGRKYSLPPSDRLTIRSSKVGSGTVSHVVC